MAFLVMGSLNYDDNYVLDHIVMPGETIASQTMESACGGKGFNQAVALAKAGAEVYLAGLVGEADGARICQEARENGIKDTSLKKRGLYRKGHHPDRPDRPEQYRTFWWGQSAVDAGICGRGVGAFSGRRYSDTSK